MMTGLDKMATQGPSDHLKTALEEVGKYAPEKRYACLVIDARDTWRKPEIARETSSVVPPLEPKYRRP
jgi:hypothetical protein